MTIDVTSVKFTDVMVDLETLGTAPGSVIISIGAVAWAEGLGETEWASHYSGPINRASSAEIGLTADVSTIDWWARQPEEARAVYEASLREEGVGIAQALLELAAFFPTGARLWSNGANFDGVLLREAYRRAGIACPWPYYDECCYRTVKNRWRAQVPAPAFQGVKHSALDDARHQARHLAAIDDHIARMALAAASSIARGFLAEATSAAPGGA